MLTLEDARSIAGEYREQFIDTALFEQSWSRFFDMTGDPNPEKLRHWLDKDLAKDTVRHAGIVKEPVLPVRQDLPDLVDDCECCRGKRWVRRDLPIGHADFGKAMRCPRCHG